MNRKDLSKIATLAAILWLPPATIALETEMAQTRFKPALPGYAYDFPRDHASHPAFKTEWWYYTGHLETSRGRRFGYQLTFFRSGMDHPDTVRNPSRWAIRELYLAHFAVTDEQDRQFFYADRVNRAGVENAGARTDTYRVWNENWSAGLPTSAILENPDPSAGRPHRLIATEKGWGIDLLLTPATPPVIHGEKGISRKGAGTTQASHYYSYPRMRTQGTIRADDGMHVVTGSSWMDHEFGTSQLSDEQAGWDWFGLQLDNGTSLMLYHLRKKDGAIDPFSSGTWITPAGDSRHLPLSEFSIQPTGRWTSPNSGAEYPSGWRIRIPSAKIELRLQPTVTNQELITDRSTGVTYWEGSVRIEGNHGERQVRGQGYVELTGYAGGFEGKF